MMGGVERYPSGRGDREVLQQEEARI